MRIFLFLFISNIALSANYDDRYSVYVGGVEYSYVEILADPGYQEIQKIENIDLLVSENPEIFEKLLVKSGIHSKLFRAFSFNRMMESLPKYRSNYDKISDLASEFMIWRSIIQHSKKMMNILVREQLGESGPLPPGKDGFDIWDILYSQDEIWNDSSLVKHQTDLLIDDIFNEMSPKIDCQVGYELGTNIRENELKKINKLFSNLDSQSAVMLNNYFRDYAKSIEDLFLEKVVAPVSGKLFDNMKEFEFIYYYKNNFLDQYVKKVASYVGDFFQVASMVMRYSNGYLKMKKNLADKISKLLPQDEVEDIILNLNYSIDSDIPDFISAQMLLLDRENGLRVEI